MPELRAGAARMATGQVAISGLREETVAMRDATGAILISPPLLQVDVQATARIRTKVLDRRSMKKPKLSVLILAVLALIALVLALRVMRSRAGTPQPTRNQVILHSK